MVMVLSRSTRTSTVEVRKPFFSTKTGWRPGGTGSEHGTTQLASKLPSPTRAVAPVAAPSTRTVPSMGRSFSRIVATCPTLARSTLWLAGS